MTDIYVIPNELSVIFQKMKTCSFCKVRLGEEAIGLNYLSTIGYFVCGENKCKILSDNYKYFIIRSVYSIGVREPFKINDIEEIHVHGWNFSKMKKTTYLNTYNRICVLVEKNNKQKEIVVSDLLKWNIDPGNHYIEKYIDKYKYIL